jgi:putative ABC transport system substrate-binding protein
MDRRTFIGTLAAGILAVPLDAGAQQPGKVYRIGFLSPRSPSDVGRLAAFRQGLRELGYVEGRDLVQPYAGRRAVVGGTMPFRRR